MGLVSRGRVPGHRVSGVFLCVLLTGSVGSSLGADTNADPVSNGFGSTVPSDHFVQSFQQEVSRQLQAAISQADQSQAARLKEFEVQQKSLEDQLREIRQELTAGARPGVSTSDRSFGIFSGSTGSEQDAPRVNQRQIGAGKSAEAQADDFYPLGLEKFASDTADATDALAPRADWLVGGNSLLATNLIPTPNALDNRSVNSGRRRPDSNIAPHGFIEGRLLNGVVAIVGGPERESIVALSGSYQSANGFRAYLDGCLALVQGRPELPAGRIDFKLSRLTCNFPDGASRTWDTAGWLVDTDGIRGLRATIVENAGRKALAAAAGGALGGVGQRLSQQQYQVNSFTTSSTGGVGGSSSSFVGSVGRDALGGAATGGANALTQSIDDYYRLYSPSLQVGGGTPVTVVLANDLRLPASGRQVSQTHLAPH